MSDLISDLTTALGQAYRIDRELGGGGMSRVFVATEIALDRQIVIKVLPPELALGLSIERFRREIQLSARLQHPHIVPLLSAGAANGLLYYTMPLVEGESLRSRLARAGELPVSEAVRILTQVVDALAYAHARGLVHRDIKPDNILLSGKHAFVTDFGVSKALADATGAAAITSVGVALGTPAYMSPEQAAADPAADQRSDIYSLGVVGYELLTGHTPFAGQSAQQLFAAHTIQAPAPISQSRPAVSPALEAVILRCLAKRPADRQPNADALLAELERLATTSAETPAHRPPLRSRRRWIAGLGAAAVAAAVLGFALLSGKRATAASAHSVAVLPFENIGGGEAGQSLADGLQDDILTQLTKISALQVTSRASVQDYRKNPKPMRDVGRELGVRALLTGQVQRSERRVHVNVQLVEPASDRQLWADTYDRELTAQDVFAIQDNIAKSVAEALRVQLTPAEAAAISETATGNLEALDYYHHARDLFNRRGSIGPDTEAPHVFERAVAIDPQFAQAWAGLAEARSWLIRQGLVRDTAPARAALDHALSLAPHGSETALARGFYEYYGKGEYATALAQFRAALAARPSDAVAAAGVGYILRRQGDWKGALEIERHVADLDPRDPAPFWDLGGTYLAQRQYADAIRTLDRALILYPDYDAARYFLYSTFVAQGDTARAAQLVQESPGHVSPWFLAMFQSDIATKRRDFGSAIRILRAAVPPNAPFARGRLLLLALSYHYAGDASHTTLYADSVRLFAEADLRRLAGWPDVFGSIADVHSYLGMAYALLGRAADAIREGREAVQMNPVSRDAIEGPRSTAHLAAIYVLTGDRDNALDRLRFLSSIPTTHWRVVPGMMSAAILRLDPLYDPLRSDARFQELVRSAEARESRP